MKSVYGIETVDSVCSDDFETYLDFRIEVRSMVENYHMAGIPVYKSQRCTNDWKNK